MRHLSDTIRRLRPQSAAVDARSERLKVLAASGTNPGNLNAWHHVPDGDAPMPLVVVLHGCTQTAPGYDAGSGWSTLAERHRFAVLFPEQQRGNNPNGCFNWFVPEDVRRDSGEVRSIREMIAAMVDRYPIDPARVFVTGLSAGGAMASALLASYPEVFAGAAIIAGLPAGAASTVPQAFDRMRGHGHVDSADAVAHVRNASDHRGSWPSVAVWHGSADATVAPSNAEAILGQWQALHGVGPTPDRVDTVDGAVHRSWLDAGGRICLEDYRIAGMGHGTPIATAGETASGSPAAYMLDVGVSSTWHSATRWGLLDPAVTASTAEPGRADIDQPTLPPSVPSSVPSSIQATIEAALKSAGLMR